MSIAILGLSVSTRAFADESTCFGTVSNGRLTGGVRLPLSGSNFSSYSSLAANVGRTYVHSKVLDVVLAAYSALEKSAPRTVFVYGETGWAAGGRIRPHRTHQNGLSVDFFVPVRDRTGRSVALPTSVTNRFGYDIEFDSEGRFEEYTIDFEALAEHLYQLHVAATARGVGIALVILDPPFLPKLFATTRGSFLQQNLKFMRGAAWVRHDEHYHVDFAVPCKSMTANPRLQRTRSGGLRPPARAAEPERCADASARRADWRTPSSQAVELVSERRPVAPWEPPNGPAAPGSRRIGAAAWGRRGLGPLARPIPRLEPSVPSASQLASWPAAQPPPRYAAFDRAAFLARWPLSAMSGQP